jgi:hypothetical protein
LDWATGRGGNRVSPAHELIALYGANPYRQRYNALYSGFTVFEISSSCARGRNASRASMVLSLSCTMTTVIADFFLRQHRIHCDRGVRIHGAFTSLSLI